MSHHAGGPYPPLPPTITIPNIQVTTKEVGTLQIPTSTPFYYSGISAVWIHWPVELAVLEEYLHPLGMVPATFGGRGAVNVNFFNAVALYGQGSPGNNGVGGFNETEVNIVAYPKSSLGKVPELTLEEFVQNGDQTKRMGNYRVWVACDDAIAVAAGQQIYLENKFLTQYSYNVPALNNQGRSTWQWTCHDPNDVNLSIYQAAVNLAGLSPVPGNLSEWIDLSYSKTDQRVAGSRRNYFGMYDTYLLGTAGGSAVQVMFGQSPHPMRRDMERLLGSARAAVVQVYQSPCCIAEARPYWADT